MLQLSSTAWAQDEEPHEYVPGEMEVVEAAETPWDYFLRLGLGVSFGSSTSVIGNADGNTWTVSFGLESHADYYRNGHELRNTSRARPGSVPSRAWP
jgi:hypothetical protein